MEVILKRVILCSFFTLILSPSFNILFPQIQKFAVIGDYGTNDKCNTNESAVAQMVNSWNPAFIITLGDNIYFGKNNNTQNSCTHEHVNDYDSVVKKYYGNYFTKNINTNRFYPCIGDHEIAGELDMDPRPGFYLRYYLDFFVLPGNERYYTFQKGNIRFISLNNDFAGRSTYTVPGVYSDTTVWEPDGIDSSSVQGQWCRNILDTSTAKWKIVYQHKPPYFSFLESKLDMYKRVRWPFKRWGAHIVLTGDLHWYERVRKDNMTYITNGLGGGKFDPLFDDTLTNFVRIPESKLLYNDNYGAQIVEEYNDSLVFKFVTISGEVIDRYVLLQPRTVKIKTLLEGTYDPDTEQMVSDTVKILLRSAALPYNVVDSAKAIVDVHGNGLFKFNNASYDSLYYIVVSHRNSIETWSRQPVTFDDELQYDFSEDSTSAFGFNLIRIGDKWCIYSGDVVRDGIVDGTDMGAADNDATEYVTGYTITDVNGDGLVDGTDMMIIINNVQRYIFSITPEPDNSGINKMP